MKLLFTFLFAIIFLGNSYAQKKIDSLKYMWFNQMLSDSTRLTALNNLIEDYYLLTKTDSALVLSKQMLDFAQKKKRLKFEIEALTLIGKVYFEKEENVKAVESYTKGLELSKTIEDHVIYAKKLYDLGELYRLHEDYTIAFKTFEESRNVAKRVGDHETEGWSIDRLGLIHSTLGNYDESEKYHLEHVQLSTKHGIKRSISGANGDLAGFYYLKGDISKSIKYWKKAIRLSKEIGLEEYASLGTGLLLNIYINEKQFDEAIKYLEEYKAVTKQFTVPKYARNFSLNIHLWQCQIDYGLKKYTKALRECEDCLNIYKINNWNPESEIFKSLYQVNKKLNRHATALDYFEKYQIAIDDEKEDRARTEIQNIIFNNQITADSIAQAQEKVLLNTTYEASLNKKNREKNLSLIVGLLLLLLAVAYFLVSRRIAAAERKRLKEVNQLKNALFTNITHEFRTPLTVIKGMTDTIKSNLVNEQLDNLENSLEMIERNSDGLLHLVNELLDLAKLESGNMELQLVQTDVIPFLKYLSESFSSLADEHEVGLTIYAEIDSLTMDFDSNKLSSIISNVLSNAIKFTPKFGKIIVHINQIIQKERTYLFIKIKDNGIGISKEELPNIFNRFYQTDASTIRKNEGTGIGLALTKELVELMQGTIEVKSKLKKGSEFSIMLPVTRKAPISKNVEINNVFHSSSSKKLPIHTEQILDSATDLPLVLIIEDNMDVAHYLKICLSNKYESVHAINGKVGIEMALEKIPDIIICDVMMPEKDGFEVCETLKTDERSDHIPIIILTAKVTIEDRLNGLSHGADAYLAKPFIKEELFTRLDQLVSQRKKLISKIQKDGFNTLLKRHTKNPKLQFLQKVVKLIHEDLDNANFGSEDLVKKLFISDSQIYRKIKAITGKSTAVFIRSVRLKYAKELLSKTDKTVSEIAYEVGFKDPSWFSRAFKEEFNVPPSEISK